MPERPTDVRIVHKDGTETCELAYDGQDDRGMHVWKVMTALNVIKGDKLKVARLPARTTIAIGADLGG